MNNVLEGWKGFEGIEGAHSLVYGVQGWKIKLGGLNGLLKELLGFKFGPGIKYRHNKPPLFS